MSKKVLVILTSHGQLGDTGRKTGFYWEEFATPYWKLRDAGHTVDIASVKGGNPPADPGSAQPDGRAKSVQRFMDDAKAMAALKASKPIEEAEMGDYGAVFLPGGHGTMWDLAQTSSVGEKIARAFEAGAVVAAVCHGPAGLTNAILSNGEPLVKGRKVNSFTDAEEEAAGLTEVVPYRLESRIRELGGIFEGNPSNFQAHSVRDGSLITGQNPSSSEPVVDHMIAALSE